MKISRTASFGIGVVATLVIGSGTAYAATGGTFVLGKSNGASSTTTLTNSAGSALSLNSKSGYAPLRVNHSTKVTNLNADLLDGLDYTKFALTAGQTNTIHAVGAALDLIGNDGVADTIAAAATCPAGSRLTGGGGDDFTSDGILFVNAPSDKTTWVVISSGDVNADDPTDVDAYAICYNPRGAVEGGEFRTTTSQFSTSQLSTLKKQAAKKVR